MNIDYIINEFDVNYILKNETPVFKLYINSKEFIMVYKLNNLYSIGAYSNDSLDDNIHNNISNMNNDIRKKIKQLNNDCCKLYRSFENLKELELFEEIDVQHYQQKLNDKLRNKFEQFVDIISNL